MSSNLFQDFIKYEGEKSNLADKGWYTCKDGNDDVSLILDEGNYTLRTKFSPTVKGAICFRIEDFKEYFFNDKRKGPKDNDLTILSYKDLYQIEFKEMGDSHKVNSQFSSGDNWVKFIMWFNSHINMSDYNQLNIKHIFIRIKGAARVSLRRKKQKAVQAKICNVTKRDNCNYIKVILQIDPESDNFRYIDFDINQVIKKALSN